MSEKMLSRQLSGIVFISLFLTSFAKPSPQQYVYQKTSSSSDAIAASNANSETLISENSPDYDPYAVPAPYPSSYQDSSNVYPVPAPYPSPYPDSSNVYPVPGPYPSSYPDSLNVYPVPGPYPSPYPEPPNVYPVPSPYPSSYQQNTAYVDSGNAPQVVSGSSSYASANAVASSNSNPVSASYDGNVNPYYPVSQPWDNGNVNQISTFLAGGLQNPYAGLNVQQPVGGY